MLEDLGQWEEAKRVAQKVDPSLLPRLLFKHGEALENDNQHLMALDKYNQVLNRSGCLVTKSILGV